MITGFEKIVEERIRRSLKNGEFDNLAGAGKPLEIEDISRIPEDLRLAYKMLKNADCVPPEIEIKKEIHSTEALLENLTDEKQKYKTLKKLNYLILKLNSLRTGAVKFDIPQMYEAQVVDCLSSDKSKNESIK
jgi:DnaJ-like protein